MGYGYNEQEKALSTLVGQVRNQSLTERLTEEKQNLEFRLNQINDVLKILQTNPQVQQVLDVLAKVGIR